MRDVVQTLRADWLRETITLGWKGELICSKNSQICENDNSREGVGFRVIGSWFHSKFWQNKKSNEKSE